MSPSLLCSAEPISRIFATHQCGPDYTPPAQREQDELGYIPATVRVDGNYDLDYNNRAYNSGRGREGKDVRQP